MFVDKHCGGKSLLCSSTLHRNSTNVSPSPHGVSFPFFCLYKFSILPFPSNPAQKSLLFHLPIQFIMFPANFPAKFLALVVVFHLNSAVSATDDAAMATPISCDNCTICQSACRPPPYEPLPLSPPPPPPFAEPEPLPVPVAPANCPPTIVQCCQFLPPPPPQATAVNGNIYTPIYNESSSSFLKVGLASVLAPVFGLAAIF